MEYVTKRYELLYHTIFQSQLNIIELQKYDINITKFIIFKNIDKFGIEIWPMYSNGMSYDKYLSWVYHEAA